MKNKLNQLQQKNVFIHTNIEHYNDGSNICFSIEFRDYDKQTGWYNDNHEFGDAGDVFDSAIQLAEWYLEDIERIKDIDGLFYSKYNILKEAKIEEIIKDIRC